MKIKLKSLEGPLQYQATNARGNTLELSSGIGYSPMEALISAAAACSSIDVEMILKKMRQKLESIEVEVSAERRTDKEPAVFTKIHMHYIIQGQVKEKKAAEAIDLSMQKYCSVTQSLDKDIDITSSYKLID